MTPEKKILEILRKALVENAAVQAYVGDRVYAQHISTMENPTYPAISFFILISKPGAYVPLSRMVVQIDFWFKDGPVDVMMECREAVRTVLHNNPTLDSSIKCILEEDVGPMLYEQETQVYHLPMRYNIMEIV